MKIALLSFLGLDVVLTPGVVIEKLDDFPSALKTLRRILLEQFEDGLAKVLWVLLHVDLEEIRTGHSLNARRMEVVVVELVRKFSVRNLVERDTQRVEIRTVIRRFAGNDLGREIVQGALDHVRKRSGDSLGKPEIDQLEQRLVIFALELSLKHKILRFLLL